MAVTDVKMVVVNPVTNANHTEHEILRDFFDAVIDMDPQDNTVSDSKIVKKFEKEIREAVRNAEYRCTCAKMTWGCICEVCQGSDKELVYLRNFYREIRKAKKNNLTGAEIQRMIEKTKERLVD